ncbi:MAG: hypothetical protein II309_02955 [Bacilli bacterium]|nr:hypothetical protein [Bacilli bacterium]
MNEKLQVIISAEVAKFKQGIKDAKKQIDDFTEGSEKGASKMDESFKKAGEGIKSAYASVGTALAAVGASLIATSAMTEEYRENMSKLNTAFESVGASADVAKNTYNDLYRVLGDSDVAVEASNHLAKVTTNQKELSEWTNICQGVYATFGDSLPIEGLTEAINHTSKLGETQGVLADALEWSGISTDEFNKKLEKCNSESEREKLIRETLTGLYDKASTTYEKNNGELLAQRDAQAKLQDTLAKVGETMQPVITAFTSFANEALTVVTPYIQSLAENYMPQLQSALSTVAESLGVVMGFLVDNWGILLGIAGVITGITIAIGLYNTVAAVKAAMDALQVTTLGALISAYLAQAAAMAVALAPYLLIVAAIAAVIAIIVLCIKHWDKIKEATTKAFEKMKEAVQKGIDKVVSFFQKLISWVTSNWQGLLLLIVNPFAGAFKLAYDNCEGFRNKVNTVFNNIKSGIKEKVEGAKTAITTTFGKIKDGIADKLNGAKDTVKSIIDKIKGFFNFKWSLPKLKMPKISISGKFSINPPSVPKFSVSWHRLGGVFDKPTLFNYGNGLHGLGEDGAEAIVPLEKNTQWMDKLASMLSDRMGTGTPIILQVDGKTFAQTSINSINQLTKQQGKLGLNLV